jgi:hypothetical protein
MAGVDGVTVVEQSTIFGDTRTVAANGKPLTRDQQTAWDMVSETVGGVTADEVGALLHSRLATRWAHPADQRCVYCGTRGNQVLRSVALRPLVVRRRVSGKWEPRERQPAPPLEPLPDGEWEDLF